MSEFNRGDTVYILNSDSVVYAVGVVYYKFSTPNQGDFYQVVMTYPDDPENSVLEVMSSEVLRMKKPAVPSFNFLDKKKDKKQEKSYKTHTRWDGVEVHSDSGVPIDDYVDFTNIKIL